MNKNLPAIKDLVYKASSGLPNLDIVDLKGRVTTIKTNERIIVGETFACYELTEQDIDGYCKRAVEFVNFVGSNTGIMIVIPKRLIAYKESNLASLISMLKDHASNGGIAIIQCITDGERKLRVSDTLINHVDTVLNKSAHKCSVVRDVIHIRRSNVSRRRNCFTLTF